MRSDHFVAPSTSHSDAQHEGRDDGKRERRARERGDLARRTLPRGVVAVAPRGAVRQATASAKNITAANTNAPLQPIPSEAISTAPDASMPTR